MGCFDAGGDREDGLEVVAPVLVLVELVGFEGEWVHEVDVGADAAADEEGVAAPEEIGHGPGRDCYSFRAITIACSAGIAMK